MADPRLARLADVLVSYSTKVQPGDWVHIHAGWLALPLAQEVQASVLKAGGNPSVTLESQDLNAAYLAAASDAQLRWTPPLDMHMIKNADAWIILEAPENTRAMATIDPGRQQLRNTAFSRWSQIYAKRAATGELRWVMTSYPCQALAQEAEMSLSEFEDFVFEATFTDQEDALKRWQAVRDEQERLVTWLRGKETITIRGPRVDLRLSIAGRTFINSAGDENMPSGEIFTSPLETSAEGWVQFSYPAVYLGAIVEGVRLEFRKGRVIDASAEKNQDFLMSMLDTDAGSRRLGELGIGTNYGIRRFTRNILYDEKIGGSFHLALGNGYPEAGGRNKSSLHWDLITDARSQTEMHADGTLFYKDGKFIL